MKLQCSKSYEGCLWKQRTHQRTKIGMYWKIYVSTHKPRQVKSCLQACAMRKVSSGHLLSIDTFLVSNDSVKGLSGQQRSDYVGWFSPSLSAYARRHFSLGAAHMSHNVNKYTVWHARSMKTQISLRTALYDQSLLSTWNQKCILSYQKCAQSRF